MEIMNEIEKSLLIYIIGFLCSLNWIFTWQLTTLKVHFLEVYFFFRRIKKKIYTPTDFEEYTYENWGLLGELLNCPICLSHWTGAIFSSIACYILNGNWFIVLLSFFTYPIWIYFIIRKYLE